MKYNKDMRRGLTLIEILVSVGLAAIVVTIGFVAMNPGSQIAEGRNTQRKLHLEGIMNGIRQNMADTSGGSFTCTSGTIPTSSRRMASSGSSSYNIAPCLVPIYLPVMPFDPSASGAHYEGNADYDTGYFILRNASTGQITLFAPSAERGKTVSVTR
jgi:prepilin-type N-terminal cleavage/methylation domain-containing protein